MDKEKFNKMIEKSINKIFQIFYIGLFVVSVVFSFVSMIDAGRRMELIILIAGWFGLLFFTWLVYKPEILVQIEDEETTIDKNVNFDVIEEMTKKIEDLQAEILEKEYTIDVLEARIDSLENPEPKISVWSFR